MREARAASGDKRSYDVRSRSARSALGAGLLLSLLIHAGLLAVVSFPRPDDAVAASRAGWEFRHLELPPRLEVPEAPGRIDRPPPPSTSGVDIDEPSAIDGGRLSAVVAAPFPEPPRVRATLPTERPALVPHDVAPLHEAPGLFRRRLERFYPYRLRKRGVEGTVELRFFVDARGEVSRVEVAESSGHRSLDRAARRVADEMRFLPALNRDRAVGVWVTQRICFLVREHREEVPTAAECEARVAVGGT